MVFPLKRVGTTQEGSTCKSKKTYVVKAVGRSTGADYDKASNTCVAHVSMCGKDTFLKNGQCVLGKYGREGKLMKSCKDGTSPWQDNNNYVTSLQQICNKW
jgi:hypothetical protein